MLSHSIKSAWRTIMQDKIYSGINVLGLTIGLTACLLVFTVIIDEFSYDKFWKNSESIYKVYSNDKAGEFHQKYSFLPEELGYALQQQFPEIEKFSAININEEHFRMDSENPNGLTVRTLQGNTHILDMLDFQSVEGTLPDFVAGQQNLLITESFRNKYFKNLNPVGQVIENLPSWSSKKDSFLITGVIKDIPQNTHLRADVVILGKPTETPLSKDGYWGGTNVYYQLKDRLGKVKAQHLRPS